jgi:hypothetical protein
VRWGSDLRLRWLCALWVALSLGCVGAAPAQADHRCGSVRSCWMITGQNWSAVSGRWLSHWDGSRWSRSYLPDPPGDPAGQTQFQVWDRSCPSGSDCWVVGDVSTDHFHSRAPAAWHWNGKRWSYIALPQGYYAYGVSCVSASECLMVGGSGSSSEALHWDGRRWSVVAGPVGSHLACLSRTYCWSAFVSATGGASIWDGSEWSEVSTPAPYAGGIVAFGRIACRQRSDCWIVGTSAREDDQARTDTIRSWAMHWDGSSLASANIPRPDHGQGIYDGPDNELYDVACATGSCWAVGYAGTAPPRYVILRWIGTKWVSMPVPHPRNGRVAKLTSLACLSASDCWAQGWIYGSGWTTIDGFQRLHWNGTRWKIWHQ